MVGIFAGFTGELDALMQSNAALIKQHEEAERARWEAVKDRDEVEKARSEARREAVRQREEAEAASRHYAPL